MKKRPKNDIHDDGDHFLLSVRNIVWPSLLVSLSRPVAWRTR